MQETPSKSENIVKVHNENTPEKVAACTTPEKKEELSPLKDTDQSKSFEFSTPKKSKKNTELDYKSPENQSKKRKAEKIVENNELKFEQEIPCDGEDDMISTTEQARLLIAASKTPSKSLNKTPAKQSTPTGKRSAENSPVTPGKFRRVELITIASPKAKRIKQL